MIKLFQGDCLLIMEQLIKNNLKFNAVITDIPYEKTHCNFDKIVPFKPMWLLLNKLIYNNTPILLFGDEPFSSYLRLSNIQYFRYDWIYQKTTPTGFLNAKKMPLRVNEIISVFYKKLPYYNPQKTVGHVRKTSTAEHRAKCKATENYGKFKVHTYDSTERFPISVIKFKTDKQQVSLHPQQKPLALMEYLINTYTKENDMILDFTAGSGTTGLACKNLNRNCILIEKEDKYISIIEERLNIKRESVISYNVAS